MASAKSMESRTKQLHSRVTMQHVFEKAFKDLRARSELLLGHRPSLT
jgi:hypothetical protein